MRLDPNSEADSGASVLSHDRQGNAFPTCETRSQVDFRVVSSVHGKTEVGPDPILERDISSHLNAIYAPGVLEEQYTRFMHGDGELDSLMRGAIWRAVARKFDRRVRIGSGVGVKHCETFEIGDGVFIGAQSYLQERFDGTTRIGNHVWLGPQSYFDGRHLIMWPRATARPGTTASAEVTLPSQVSTTRRCMRWQMESLEETASITMGLPDRSPPAPGTRAITGWM